jgi:hypothetical protein
MLRQRSRAFLLMGTVIRVNKQQRPIPLKDRALFVKQH